MRGVAAYAGRRLLIAIPLLWIVSVISYLLLYRAADPVARLRQIPGVRAEDLGRLIEQQGLDAPWYEGYWTWLGNFLHGDWGVSTSSPGSSALEVIGEALPATIELMLLALVVSTVLGVVIGVACAVRPMSRTDLALSGVAYLGFATPTFLAGVLLQLGAVWLRDNGWAVIPFALGTVLVLVALARLRRGGAGDDRRARRRGGGDRPVPARCGGASAATGRPSSTPASGTRSATRGSGSRSTTSSTSCCP